MLTIVRAICVFLVPFFFGALTSHTHAQEEPKPLNAGVLLCEDEASVHKLLVAREVALLYGKEEVIPDSCQHTRPGLHGASFQVGVFENRHITAQILRIVLYQKIAPGTYLMIRVLYGFNAELRVLPIMERV